jgi:hypothetical protein
MVIVAVAPGPTVPTLQLTVPLPDEQLPCDDVADMKVTLVGNVSMSVTPVAAEGPLLVTVAVYVRFSSTATGSSESVTVTAKSADGGTTVVVRLALLLAVLGSL